MCLGLKEVCGELLCLIYICVSVYRMLRGPWESGEEGGAFTDPKF